MDLNAAIERDLASRNRIAQTLDDLAGEVGVDLPRDFHDHQSLGTRNREIIAHRDYVADVVETLSQAIIKLKMASDYSKQSEDEE
jgi:hypothetical protein